MGILNQFMKERRHSNVMLVMQHFFHKGHLNWHIALVHEGKQPFKCNDCDAIFFYKTKYEWPHKICL